MKTSLTLAFTSLLSFGALTSFAQPEPGTLVWSYESGNTIAGSPAVAPDRTILFANGSFLAITNMGSNRWTFPIAGGSHGGYSSPAIAADGTAYLSGGSLYAVNPDGTQKWAFPADCENGSPAVGFDNGVFIHGYGLLYSLSSGGIMVWSNRIGGSYTYGSPSIAADRSIYSPAPETQSLYAISANGSRSWQAGVSFNTADTAAIAANGTVYTTGGGLYAFSAPGSNLWVNTTNSFVGSCPAIGKDGTIYVATYGGGTLYALTPSGDVKWKATLTLEDSTNAPPIKCPAIDSQGTIYHAAFHSLYAISPQGNVEWTFTHPGDTNSPANRTLTSPAIGPDGTIYVTFGSKLYALYGTNKLADSPWPMYRQNARHTGKVEKPSLQQPKKRADANFEFQLYAQIDQTQTVQTSTDLVAWAPLTNIVVTNVPMDVVDLCASNFPTRFYRTLSQ